MNVRRPAVRGKGDAKSAGDVYYLESNMSTLRSTSRRTSARWLSAVGFALLLALDLAGWAQGGPPAAPGGGVPAGRQASNVVIITIHGPIDDVTVRSVQRRIALAQQAGADAIVFEINTWGGLATATLDICSIIKQCPITNTIAWVNPKAISAGAFIALACKEIVMAPGGYMGDCAPIVPNTALPAAERAKMESPLLAQVVDSARRRGYDERLVMSFVAVDIELWLVEEKDSGNRLFIDRGEYAMLFGDDPPETVRARASGGLAPAEGQAVRAPIPFLQELIESQGEQSGLSREEIARQIELNQELLSARPALSRSDRGRYVLVEPVIDNKTLLVVYAEKARRWGLSQETIANEEELKAFLGAATIARSNQTWSEELVQLLTSTPVRALLLVVFLVGLIWEMATPGVGVPLTISLGAAVLLFGAPALTGLAQWWDIVLVLAGIALLGVELFLLPGFGVAGIAGIVCIGIGFVGTFMAPDPSGSILPTSELARQAMLRGLSTLLLGFFAGGVALWVGVKNFSRVPGLSRLVLNERLPRHDEPESLLGAMAPSRPGPEIGSVGVVVSTLRPVGRARIGAVIYDVVSERGIIEEGRRIRVLANSPFEIVVEDADDAG